MFTGIIEEVGKVESLHLTGRTAEIEIAASRVLEGLHLGDSIAVNGVCLTVRSKTSKGFKAEVSGETLARTSFAQLKSGSSVNLERPLSPTSRLGGHFVQGHIDDVGRVMSMESCEGFATYQFSLPTSVRPYVVEKGSIAIDGISLTVSKLGSDFFQVALVPHTTENTNLGQRRVGEVVNLECDVLAKYVESLLNAKERSRQPMTLDYLKEQGY